MKCLSLLTTFFLFLALNTVWCQTVTPQFERIDDPLLSLRTVFQATIVNAEAEAVAAHLFIQIRTGNSESVFEWYRPNFIIPPGVTRLTQSDQLSGISVYGSSSAAAVLNQTGRLTFGDYIVCLKLYSAADNSLIAEDCREKSVVQFVPPMLVFPADGAVLNQTKTDFSWIGPQPAPYFECNYAFVVVEFDSSQSLEWNILNQPPLVAKQNLPLNRLAKMQYEYEFEVGQTYAWRIAAHEGSYVIGTTDVWTFTVEEKDSIAVEQKGSYRLIKKEKEGGFYFTDQGILRFAYDNRAHDKTLSYEILSLTEGSASDFVYPEVALYGGTNNVELDLRSVGRFVKDQSYKLVVRDGKSDVYQLIFTYKN